MRRITLFLALLLIPLFALTGVAAGAEIEDGATNVLVVNLRFLPRDVTIDQGETVTWINNSTYHNVVANDGSFTSGEPAPGPWTFQHTFDTPGTYPYYCVLHGNAGGGGMAGTVTVNPLTPQVRSAAIVLVPRAVGAFHLIIGLVVVRDDAGAPVPGATVSANWTLPNGVVQSRTAQSNANGLAFFFTLDGLGTYTLDITDITAPGYTFDPAGSVLTRSITVP